MGRFSIYVKTSNICEDFLHMGVFTISGKTSHILDVFPYMGSHTIYGKAFHIWEDFPSMGRLHIYCKSSHILYWKTSHIWEDFPYMGRLPIHEKSVIRLQAQPQPQHGQPTPTPTQHHCISLRASQASRARIDWSLCSRCVLAVLCEHSLCSVEDFLYMGTLYVVGSIGSIFPNHKFMAMHSYILGCPSILGCIPIHGYPGIWESNPTWGCIPIDWGTPLYGNALSMAFAHHPQPGRTNPCQPQQLAYAGKQHQLQIYANWLPGLPNAKTTS